MEEPPRRAYVSPRRLVPHRRDGALPALSSLEIGSLLTDGGLQTLAELISSDAAGELERLHFADNEEKTSEFACDALRAACERCHVLHDFSYYVTPPRRGQHAGVQMLANARSSRVRVRGGNVMFSAEAEEEAQLARAIAESLSVQT